MKNIFCCCIAFLTLFFSGCEKDGLTHPELQTLSVTATSPTTITVVGNIVALGSEKIQDYGFVYSHDSYIDENKGTKVSLGNNPQKGQFTKTLENLVLTGNYYGSIYVRSYLKNTKGTAFGAVLNVNLPSLTTSGISPATGKVGDKVKITGQFYDTDASAISVRFNNVVAKIISVSSTEISAEVPAGVDATHGQSVNVTVNIGGLNLNNGYNYFTMQANVTDFTPKTGPVGTPIRFMGDNMPANYYYNSDILVHIGGSSLNMSYSSMNVVPVPFTVGISSEVAVTINGQRKVLPGVFTVTPPVITSTTESIFPGQNLMIYGTNFVSTGDVSNGRPMAKLGSGTYQAVSIYNSGQYVYTVPSNISEGEYTLYLKVGPHEVQAPKKIDIIGYAATTFSPSSGGPNRQVNITGRFIQGTYYEVSFGSVRTNALATSATNLQTNVPTGVNEGAVKIAVHVPNKTITLAGDFQVIGPSFSSFSPASGVPGTLITIKGAGFNPHYTMVRFGTVVVAPNTLTDDTIVVAVPSNVSPGAMKLTIETNGQTVVHNDNFTILQ